MKPTHQRKIHLENIKCCINSDSNNFIPIAYQVDANLIPFTFQTEHLQNVQIKHKLDKAYIRITYPRMVDENILFEIKKLDEYASSYKFAYEALTQLGCIKETSKGYGCGELYAYESLFKNNNCVINLSTKEDSDITTIIQKKLPNRVERISLIELKIKADEYLSTFNDISAFTNTTKYKFGSGYYSKMTGFIFPSARCVLKITGIDIYHTTQTYKLRVDLMAMEYIDDSEKYKHYISSSGSDSDSGSDLDSDSESELNGH